MGASSYLEWKMKRKQERTEEERTEENQTGISFGLQPKYGIPGHIRKRGFLCMFREAW